MHLQQFTVLQILVRTNILQMVGIQKEELRHPYYTELNVFLVFEIRTVLSLLD